MPFRLVIILVLNLVLILLVIRGRRP